MGIKKKLYKVLSLFIVFSMLSNYMFICSEITDVVFATEFEAGFSSSLELNTNTSDEEIINSEEEFESIMNRLVKKKFLPSLSKMKYQKKYLIQKNYLKQKRIILKLLKMWNQMKTSKVMKN